MYQSIVSGKTHEDRKATPKKIAFACAAAACVVIAALAAILLSGPGKPDNAALVEPGGAQTGTAAESSVVPSATTGEPEFSGFVLLAYRPTGGAEYLSANFEEEAEQLALNPDVKVLLAKYSPLMSSVPGLPFTVGLTEDDMAVTDTDSLNIIADKGELIQWNQDTGIVSPADQSVAVEGETFRQKTIYWSPVSYGEEADIAEATITVEAVADGVVVGRQEIRITRDEQGYYYAVAGEPETM
jgi:hypothetical protein